MVDALQEKKIAEIAHNRLPKFSETNKKNLRLGSNLDGKVLNKFPIYATFLYSAENCFSNFYAKEVSRNEIRSRKMIQLTNIQTLKPL